ncbi:MAG TPA: archaellin/type IV pilin N-terminal domain-containing protein [Thermoplasmata archaeon]|jgi:flagellin-like protein
MTLHRRWRRARRRGVAEIIGAILLVALTLVAGVLLWSFRLYTPPAPPMISWVIHAGGSTPVWGDPTDCQPWGYTLNSYVSMTSGQATTWVGNPNDPPTRNTWFGQCGDGNSLAEVGNYSAMNSSEFVITSHSPGNIPLNEIDFTFVCNNASNQGGTTILVNGSLASMTWFPGLSQEPAGYAPYLGYCGSFDAGSTTAANGIYYNRLGIFVPLNQGVDSVEDGDTFILYIHNGGYPLDFMCIANAGGVDFDGQNPPHNWNGCVAPIGGNGRPLAQLTLDYDDYHGAPPWCFQSVNACTILLRYTGDPSTILAEIPVYSLAPANT